MMNRSSAVILAICIALAGCAAGADEEATTATSLPATTGAAAATTTTTTAAVTTTTTGSTTTSAAPLPVSHGATTVVQGREDCDLAESAHATMTTDSDGTVRFREGWFDCVVTNNDPRIAGIAHYTLDMDRYGTSGTDATQVMWGTIRIENEGGAWEGDYEGVYTSESGDVFTVLYTGTGGYEGLSYYQWAVETRGASWPTKGVIFPGTVPVP
jgi:hypothetical protein